MKSFKLKKYFAGVNISEKTENFDDFSGLCSPEFGYFLRDLAIFQLKCMNNILAVQNVK